MMEMRRTLIAIAVMVSLATAAQAGLGEYYFPIGDHNGIKVDGSETVRWPTEFKDLTVCTIPIKLELGMYVEVRWPRDTDPIDFNDIVIESEPNDVEVDKDQNTKIVLQQVLCNDIGRESSDWPCYFDCVDINIRANFQVKLGTELVKTGGVIDQWEAYFDGTNIVTGSGKYETVTVCVKSWKARLSDAPAGEMEVGKLLITVMPDMFAPILIFEH
ncbi:MAG: hypothetical protein MUO22_07260 [Sedimentisphaerales bacterium]|nr:hypothetical protein [Sedimentisphaerales bacterium]